MGRKIHSATFSAHGLRCICTASATSLITLLLLSASPLAHADTQLAKTHLAKQVTVTVSPPSVVVPAGGHQLFIASLHDTKDKDPQAVTWRVTGHAGQILSTGPLTALVQVTQAIGYYPNAVEASFDKKSSASASIVTAPTTPTATPTATSMPTPTRTLPPTSTPPLTPLPTPTPTAPPTTPPASLATITLTPSHITLRAGATQLFTATGKDAAGNVIQGLHMAWSVSPDFGGIESTGALTALVRMGNTPGTYPSAVTAAVGSITGGADVHLEARPAPFTPSQVYAPVIANEVALTFDNHTACTALIITPPTTVVQPADNAFNIYRFVAAAPAYTAALSNYATSGQVLLYHINEDTCSTAGTLSVSFVKATAITSPSFETTLDTLVLGESYLLAVNTTGALTNQRYTMTIKTVTTITRLLSLRITHEGADSATALTHDGWGSWRTNTALPHLRNASAAAVADE